MQLGSGSTTPCKSDGSLGTDRISSAYEIILGVILGALLGFAARKFMKFAERRKLIDRQSFVAQYVSLAILSIGESSQPGCYAVTHSIQVARVF